MLCLGVLHHTEDPYKAFKNILHLIKPGGYIAIGLYNTFGRIPLKIRMFLASTVFKNNTAIKDWFIRMQIRDMHDCTRARGWWNDQYNHPHELTFTLGQILRWFKRNNIEYMQTVPLSTPFDKSNLSISGVWNKTNEIYPYFPIRLCTQISWIWKTPHEGGYWITFGRKMQ